MIRYRVRSNDYKDAQLHEKDIETIKKSEIKKAVFEINNTLEGIWSRLDKAKDRINDLEEKVERNQSSKRK